MRRRFSVFTMCLHFNREEFFEVFTVFSKNMKFKDHCVEVGWLTLTPYLQNCWNGKQLWIAKIMSLRLILLLQECSRPGFYHGRPLCCTKLVGCHRLIIKSTLLENFPLSGRASLLSFSSPPTFSRWTLFVKILISCKVYCWIKIIWRWFDGDDDVNE